MAQLVGSDCVICKQRIISAPDAKFCDNCGNPEHKDCAANYKSESSTPGSCRQCGGLHASAPKTEKLTASSASGLFGVIGIVAMIALAIWLWPARYTNSKEAVAAAELTLPTLPIASPTAADNKPNPNNPVVVIETNQGIIKARLFADKAPKTVENFVDLVNKDFYNGIIFHRIIKDFMIQTGDPTGTGSGGREDKGLPTKKLEDEFHPDLKHDRPFILSMANAGPNTGDTQFFITTKETPWLDNKHAIFGEVISGREVVRTIENSRTSKPGDRPLEKQAMLKVYMQK